MSERLFIDSNVLLYAVSDHPHAATAWRAVGAGHAISVQVLNEFASVARRKLGRTPAEIRGVTQRLRSVLDIVPITLQMHDEAIDLHERYRYAFYDSLIIAAALQAGCTRLMSEDLQSGQLIEGRLRIENPFA